jgi:transposase
VLHCASSNCECYPIFLCVKTKISLPKEPTTLEELKSLWQDIQLAFETLSDTIEKQETLLGWYARQVHGTKSEKLIPWPNDLQQTLDLNLEQSNPNVRVDIVLPNPAAPVKAKRISKLENGHGMDKFPDHLRRVYNQLALSAEQQEMVNQGKATIIGYEETQKIAFTPSELYVIVYQRPTVVIIAPDGDRTLVTTNLPETANELGRADLSLVLYIIVSKYMDHLPLHRLHSMFKRQGYSLSSNTMYFWMTKFQSFLVPIVQAMWEDTISGTLIQSDDTTLRVMASHPGDKVHTGYIFVYLGSNNWVYWYARNRNQKVVFNHLEKFEGTLLTDGHNCYDYAEKLNKLKKAGCHAHCRRYFFEAYKAGRLEADHILKMYQKLYRLEAEWKRNNVSKEEQTKLRQELSKPIIMEMRTWCVEYKRTRSVRNLMGKAIEYFLNQWERLIVFLDDGSIPIDNNASENALRNLKVGQNNCQLVGNDKSAQMTAIFYSILQTCKYLGINPYEYLTDIWKRYCTERIESYSSLTPKYWQQAREAQK